MTDDVFSPPHRNGSNAAPRGRRPWELAILGLLFALLCIGIIVGWTLYGSRSPERLDGSSAPAVAAACTGAEQALRGLPNAAPVSGADRIARVRAEDRVLRSMLATIAAVHPRATTPARALRGWATDASNVVEARERYASTLAGGGRAQLVLPAYQGIKPVTARMDDFVRENHPHLDACFTAALQLDVVEGERVYEKVTQ